MERKNHNGISQSAISLYRHCPYAYYLRYKLRCEPMFWDRSAMDTGSLIHKAIEKYYKFHYDVDVEKDYIFATSYSELSKIWDRSLGADNLLKAYNCLNNHSLWEYKNISNGLRTKPLCEVELCHNGFYGFIDYVHPINFKPVDYKSGLHASLRYEYLMQSYVYKKLIDPEFGVDIEHFYFFFLHPNEWRTVKYETDKMNKVGEDVEKMKSDILDEKFLKEPRIKSGCENCDYKYYCKILGL